MMKEKKKKRAALSQLFLLWSSLLPLLCIIPSCGAQSSSDTTALLKFKASADIGNKYLSSWNTTDCCFPSSSWAGVTCQQGRVSKLSLRSFGLTGTIEALSSLTELRVLILADNDFTGSLPDFTSWKHLWLLILSSNRFTGTIPSSVGSLSRLWRLDLSYNSFNGSIPVSINGLTRLLTLHFENNNLTGPIPQLTLPYLMDLSLHHNHLTGMIPPLHLPNLTSFDASFNNLSGPIPLPLSKFPTSAFIGNVYLCGGPLKSCNQTSVASNPASPFFNVPSNPSSGPLPPSSKKESSKLSLGAILAIVIGDVILLLVLALILLLYFWRKTTTASSKDEEVCKPSKLADDMGCLPSSSTQQQAGDASQRTNHLIFFEDCNKFELEDLLGASAEMLGKGSFGTAYKAVMKDGSAVAVKRLKEANATGKKEFEDQMERIGRLQHPNLVPLRAYYYAKDEKLLVYDYMPNGSLYVLLHGNRGLGREPLDWTTRFNIALGAARGLAHIHEAYNAPKMHHGNIKSSNILLDRDGNACISDFGLTPLMNQSVVTSRVLGYKSPELVDNKKVSQRTDVYSFGVLLLEILTGKIPAQSLQDEGVDLPRWVQSVVREEWTAEVFDLELMRYKHIEEEMVSLLQIAMSCVSLSSQQRPKMSQVVKMIEDLSLSRESNEESPSTPISDEVGPSSAH